jgi:hypothetical protein
VAEIEKAKRGKRSNKYWVMVVLPAPDGAAKMITLCRASDMLKFTEIVA